MDYAKLEAVVEKFEQGAERDRKLNVSPWVVLRHIAEVMDDAKGGETLESIGETYPRDMIYSCIDDTTRKDRDEYPNVILERLQNYIEMDCEDDEQVEKYNKLNNSGELAEKIRSAIEEYVKKN